MADAWAGIRDGLRAPYRVGDRATPPLTFRGDPRRPRYAQLMEWELVKVADGHREVDGIVFDAPSKSKVTVAVMDAARGPVFRSVSADAVTERTDAGPDDRALSLLIRRSWQPARGGSTPGGAGSTRGQDGHTRA